MFQLVQHLHKNNLFNPFQSAYRFGHSTETLLLSLVNDLLTALDEDKMTLLLMFDLSAAFDTIDHHILLLRLERRFGIRSTALQWFISYLSNRSLVSVNKSFSSDRPLTAGVPRDLYLVQSCFCYTQHLCHRFFTAILSTITCLQITLSFSRLFHQLSFHH